MRERPTGICKMCGETRALCDSHLVPTAMYRLLRRQNSENPHPVVVSDHFRGRSSHQYKDYVFCEECEHRLSANGENWMLRNCCKDIQGTFPLRDVLHRSAPIEQAGLIKTYSASRAQVEWEKLAYFAASVFWRASIHDWPLGKQTIERVAISPKYREELRRFLLGKAGFPRQAALFAWVSALPQPLLTVHFPMAVKRNDLYMYLAGMRFDFQLGYRVHPDTRAACLVHGPEHPVLSSPLTDQTMAQEFMRVAKRDGKTLREIAGLPPR